MECGWTNTCSTTLPPSHLDLVACIHGPTAHLSVRGLSIWIFFPLISSSLDKRHVQFKALFWEKRLATLLLRSFLRPMVRRYPQVLGVDVFAICFCAMTKRHCSPIFFFWSLLGSWTLVQRTLWFVNRNPTHYFALGKGHRYLNKMGHSWSSLASSEHTTPWFRSNPYATLVTSPTASPPNGANYHDHQGAPN